MVNVSPPLNARSVVVALFRNGVDGVPVNCEYGSERFARVTMELMEVVAASWVMNRGSKSELKVVV